MFQYGEAVLVGPVVQYCGEEEDRDVLLPCRLGRKEVVALGTQMSVVPTPTMQVKIKRTLELHVAGFDCVGHVLLPVL
jgi:hypothetical protein